jgi:hypothetical protein
VYYKDRWRIKEDSLCFGKKYAQKYIYPIKITPHFSEFVGHHLPKGSKLNGEYFWKHMSAEALEDARNGRAFIEIDYAQENYIDKKEYINLHEILKHSMIPAEQIILTFNSFNGQQVYESWFSPEERRLIVKTWPHVMTSLSYDLYHANPDQCVSITEWLSTKQTIRSHYYLFKNRNAREHRKAFLFMLAQNNLLSFGDWSFMQTIEYTDGEVRYLTAKYDFPYEHHTVRDLCNQLPKNLISERNLEYGQVSAWSYQYKTAHLDSYFDICTESFVNGEHRSLTEKVFKPIASFQPFLFISFAGALDLLKQLGFKTFAPYINEDYDQEPDTAKRMHMIHNEVSRLCKMDKNQIHEWYWNMQDILIHNYEHLKLIHKNEPMGLELHEYLLGKIST